MPSDGPSSGGSPARKRLTRHEQTTMLSPLAERKDAYAERRARLVEKMIARGVIPDAMIEVPVLFSHIDVFGHVSTAKWFEFTHTCIDRMGSCMYRSVLNEKEIDGLLTGKGPYAVLPLGINVRFRLPMGWPDSVLVGCRPTRLDLDGREFGETFEAFSLKTGELAFSADYTHVHIDLRTGGNAVSFKKLVETDAKWKDWIADWQKAIDNGKEKMKAFKEAEKAARSKERTVNEEIAELKKLRSSRL